MDGLYTLSCWHRRHVQHRLPFLLIILGRCSHIDLLPPRSRSRSGRTRRLLFANPPRNPKRFRRGEQLRISHSHVSPMTWLIIVSDRIASALDVKTDDVLIRRKNLIPTGQ